MDFRLKCAAHRAFSVLPAGRWLAYMMQRHVTRSVPVSDAAFWSYRERAERHLNAYVKATSLGMPRTVFDIGSGWDLCVPILMGVATRANGSGVVASDIVHGMREGLVADILMRLGLVSLKQAHVFYEAPIDYSATPYRAGRFDLITSTSTLEHVPAEQIPAVLRECRRILEPQGVCSMYVDMSDHWSHGDSSIGELNFLRYSPEEWRSLNPSSHFQNRLRFPDYMRLFKEAGFQVEVSIDTRWDGELVLHPSLEYSEEDARITRAWFALRLSGCSAP